MTKMKQTTQDQAGMQVRPANVQAPQHQHTGNITISGVGKSEDDERFLKVAVGEKTALLNVDNIADPRSAELKRLTPLGEPLIKPAARAEFLARAHDAARAEPTFEVALKTVIARASSCYPRVWIRTGPRTLSAISISATPNTIAASIGPARLRVGCSWPSCAAASRA